MMFNIDQISFGFKRKVPLVRQTEAMECGLACVAMVCGYFGLHVGLPELRKRFSISLQGATMADLGEIAEQQRLGSRALSIDMCELKELQLPAILHWEFNHFVVLTRVEKNAIYLNDPALGLRIVEIEKASQSFTGVALEFWPDDGFIAEDRLPRVSLKRLIGTLEGAAGAAAQVIFLALCIELIGLLIPLFMQWVMDRVIVTADSDLLLTLAIGFGLLVTIQCAISTLRSWTLLYVNSIIGVQWRANLFTHLVRLPVDFFQKRSLGDIVSKFGSIDQIQRVVTTSFIEGVIDGVFALAVVILMFVISPLLAGCTVAAVALYVVGRTIMFTAVQRSTQDLIIAGAKQHTHFLESVRGIRAIKMFQREEERRAVWLNHLGDQVTAEIKTQRLQLFFRTLSSLTFSIENIIVIALGASLVIDNVFTPGVLVAFVAYKGQFVSRTQALIEKLFDLRLLRLQCERLADIAYSDRDPLCITQPDSKVQIQDPPGIRFTDVVFRYAETSPEVLRGVNFFIEAGTSVCLAGPSGCGKSTVANILLGVYAPTSGIVEVGGVDMLRIKGSSFRKLIGCVSQDDVLFAGSIIDNITFFDANPDHDWAIQCAEAACIHGEIRDMPMAYHTLVGEMGSVLSGGQKQRVLLARALYKKPKILVLDEATSHLDILTERDVNEAINKMQITRLIIAHRPETIGSADRVILLAGGKVINEPSDASSNSVQRFETVHLNKQAV